MSNLILVATSEGTTSELFLDEQILNAAVLLKDVPTDYFVIDNKSIMIPVSSLILSRARPDGIRNALSLMASAAAGRLPRRKAIDIQKRDSTTFLVIDGNSTAAIALAAGWKLVPCHLPKD